MIVGAPASIQELLTNFLLGFIFGYKIIGAFVVPSALNDPQSFILSTNGSAPVGILVGIFFLVLKWYEKNKVKLPKPEEKTYKIYSVKKYSGMTNNDINAVKKEYTIKRILEKIEDDNGYHIRIDPEKNYIFFGDVDGHLKKIKDFSEFLVQFFKNKDIMM
jgi:hypothetical protein